jgi:tRNA(Ile2) C34 agmatinyltransferase TiaS
MTDVGWPDCRHCETNADVAGSDGLFYCFNCGVLIREDNNE